jgi:succinate dehydrogenase / fumarate reductase cytochrome b subunit
LSAPAVVQSSTSPRQGELAARRLFTLSGVAPLGAFLVLHAITNARAVRGEAAFLGAVAKYDRVPALGLLEALLVYLPLLFHGSYGLWLTVTRKPLPGPTVYSPGWRLAVRATGAVGAAFVALHLSELRFRAGGLLDHPSGGQLLTWLTADLSSTFHGWPLVAVAYLFASACATFHFVAGSWGVFAATRHGQEDGRARSRSAWAAALAGAALWLMFANTVVLHATGTGLLGAATPPAADDAPAGPPCPSPSSASSGPR